MQKNVHIIGFDNDGNFIQESVATDTIDRPCCCINHEINTRLDFIPKSKIQLQHKHRFYVNNGNILC